ncbi:MULTISPECIES: GntR family transcriptional regulator [Streptomyces]|uniref:DNA-binding GntR family transcriptional regulator n=2 Tax=Streptomyces stelliscabiei TaxID=146820 RepID=A0A8I0TNM3_9ACTN|nr:MULTISPECIES: GntR family transcriptional regulator [Streptomyces]MBE1594694.1 DNA-binding GntR family transcriptional regulator [Streptomyces stelliscabiei]MDX2518977.1 GntR family transcriptional regulator [Streptomyces stelliscabiei]MDX2550834.1 GntR family transcriptional regulator [Streptomyces stelliscabiei]MDX2616684.1 GntR family transcriptional regulator [Streptomyces stelliscabiei]MDX2635779.1 GntR family transcriptional regulator [Streptomyces stelliscabiei]
MFPRLRDSIVRGEPVPGEKVRDGELAECLGLSRTPVREALARLADIGLVEAKPGVYTRITTLNRRDAEKTLAVLRSLDRLATETAVPVMTEHDFRRMREANRDFERAVAAHDIGGALDADDRFHAVPVEAADNPVLSRIVEQLHPQIHRILHRRFSTLLGGRNTIEHHDELIDVCRRKRPFRRRTLRTPLVRTGRTHQPAVRHQPVRRDGHRLGHRRTTRTTSTTATTPAPEQSAQAFADAGSASAWEGAADCSGASGAV